MHSFAQDSVNVTFRINTAFVPDLIKDTSTVQIRGEAPFTSTFTSIKAINDGGDYWKATVRFPSNTSVNYQFFTNSKKSITNSDMGIEADINSDNGKRKITVGFQDTVLDLQFVNGWNSKKPDQYAKPFIEHEGKFVVWVRVNMETWYSFDTTTMKVGIRGSTMTGGDPENLSWGSTTFLTAEKPHPNPESRLFNGKYLWSGPVYINKSDAGKGLRFKFLLLDKNATSSTDWGDMIKNPDVQYEITTSGNDTTVAWKWFTRPFEPFYEKFKLHFIADLDKAITNNGFNPETDTLYVKTGLNSTANEIVSVKLENTVATIYEGDIILNFPHILKPVNAIDKINSDNKSGGKNNYLLQYAFFKVYKNSQNVKSEQKEFFYDYFDLVTGSHQQNRKVELNADSISISDELPDNVSSHRSPFFLNSNTIQQDTKIIVEVDYRPALNEVKKFNKILNDVQGTSFSVNKENIDSFDVYINGPIARIVDGKQWSIWNKNEMTEKRKMFDDGTHDDLVAGDSILTSSFDWKTTDMGATISMLFKFGINGYDNEASFGNHHFYNVKNGESIQRFRIQFGEQDPKRYPHWDYYPPNSPFVHQISTKATGYELLQNFPNPFNPTTNIQFSVPKAGLVKLDVIDLLGRTVMSFSETISSPGIFQKTITAANLTSGTYLIKMTAGSFTQTRKMIFMK